MSGNPAFCVKCRKQTSNVNPSIGISKNKKKILRAKCAVCGVVLKGVLRETPTKMKNMAKTKKRPSRPFGGVLCSKCSREKIKNESRG